MISCKTCDHYEEYLQEGYMMRCVINRVHVRYETLNIGQCTKHTNPQKQQPKHQTIACTKCGHEMRIEG